MGREQAVERSVLRFINFRRSQLLFEIPVITTSDVSHVPKSAILHSPAMLTLNSPHSEDLQTSRDENSKKENSSTERLNPERASNQTRSFPSLKTPFDLTASFSTNTVGVPTGTPNSRSRSYTTRPPRRPAPPQAKTRARVTKTARKKPARLRPRLTRASGGTPSSLPRLTTPTGYC